MRIVAASLLVGTAALMGCGQRGPLYFPDQPAARTAPRPAPAPMPPIPMPVPTTEEPQRSQDR